MEQSGNIGAEKGSDKTNLGLWPPRETDEDTDHINRRKKNYSNYSDNYSQTPITPPTGDNLTSEHL